jgi:hypothetical protein
MADSEITHEQKKERIYKMMYTNKSIKSVVTFSLENNVNYFERSDDGYCMYVHILELEQYKYIVPLIKAGAIKLEDMTPTEIVMFLSVKTLRLPDSNIQTLPENWCKFIFVLDYPELSKNLKKMDNGYVYVENYNFSFLDTTDNISFTNYKNLFVFYIKEITKIKPDRQLTDIDTFIIYDRLSNSYESKHLWTEDEVFDYLDKYNKTYHPKIGSIFKPSRKCLKSFQEKVYDKIADHQYKSSILRVLSFYTSDDSYKRIREFTNGSNNDPEIKEIIEVLNNIIYDIILRYRFDDTILCSRIVLFRGVPIGNMPILKGSIINSYKNRIQSFTDDLDESVRFAKSGMMLVLFVNLDVDVVLPIGENTIDGTPLAPEQNEDGEYILPLNTSLLVIDNPFIYVISDFDFIMVPCIIHRQIKVEHYTRLNPIELENVYRIPSP